jgi:hypothetical protein
MIASLTTAAADHAAAAVLFVTFHRLRDTRAITTICDRSHEPDRTA